MTQRAQPRVLHRRFGAGQGFGSGGGGFGPDIRPDAPSPAREQITTAQLGITQTHAIADTKQTTVTAIPGEAFSSTSTPTEVVSEAIGVNTAVSELSTSTSDSLTPDTVTSGTVTSDADTVTSGTSQITLPSSLPSASTTTPNALTSTASTSSAAVSSNINTRTSAGGIAAGITVLAAIIFLLIIFYLRRKRRRAAEAWIFSPARFKRSAAVLDDSSGDDNHPTHPTMIERPVISIAPPVRVQPRDLKYGARTDGQSAYSTHRLHDPFFDTPGQEQHLSPDEITHPTTLSRFLSTSTPYSSQRRLSLSGTSASGQVSSDGYSSVHRDSAGFLKRPPGIFSSSRPPSSPVAPPPYLPHESPITSYAQQADGSRRPRRHMQGDVKDALAPGS